MHVLAIIQARMGSSRLRGKVMRELCGKTVLEHCIDRVRQSECVNDVVVATTTNDIDLVIEEKALKCGVKVFRGSEDDVLSRYYYAAIKYNADVVLRITSDCPLIDPKVIDEVTRFYLNNKYDIVTNAPNEEKSRTYPRGLDVSIFSIKQLENAFLNAKEKYQREHVTPYLYENLKNKYYYKSKQDNSKYRLTLDTEDDWKLISNIYINLYNGKHDFYLKDILELFKVKPHLRQININTHQKDFKI
ncbi:acylneuraminate cytidylyltransferase [Clostridium botulinum]|uniref:cytidylyltransferase domain-containing protein n=1 Tax=Clostridium botulinum TaxID=1491 RepID=UPI00052D16F8|nr:glycosyltransferase family protein [Clostridium botulinum]KGM96558.1 acylneuraminate cytidylyltransferase [Clostridium botulinum D str. CCUG 7971]KOC48476.1 acylneuraminate cytidylyltransferase [Clostridium botulinum]NFO98720.1 acylneuraminate cytidylyltransferase [Clostridium botulinum]OOV50627.1 acylneuraminate cytidylyltransferase [Clostridium botulinum D/C]OOV55469.1 acylneuraminate cytidylyltransferase [Clostridium botulinum D/C]